VFFVFTIPRLTCGENVPIDIVALTQSIVVSPTFPRWAVESLCQVVRAAGISKDLEFSDLKGMPLLKVSGGSLLPRFRLSRFAGAIADQAILLMEKQPILRQGQLVKRGPERFSIRINVS
jgi:hypothetical protein